ncbi:MAG: hypothetical protein HYZ14_07505 [Bacteroidetes bacterium]|nr:hypothetical protein [Bacteroidota bacterium]
MIRMTVILVGAMLVFSSCNQDQGDKQDVVGAKNESLQKIDTTYSDDTREIFYLDDQGHKQGTFLAFYPNGHFKKECYYVSDTLHGFITIYDTLGRTRQRVEPLYYGVDSIFNQWIYYDINGDIIDSISFFIAVNGSISDTIDLNNSSSISIQPFLNRQLYDSISTVMTLMYSNGEKFDTTLNMAVENFEIESYRIKSDVKNILFDFRIKKYSGDKIIYSQIIQNKCIR